MQMIAEYPPIDQIPVTSAITAPEPNTVVRHGESLPIKGYAYSGAGRAIFRVDVSIDGGENWVLTRLTHPEKPTEYGKCASSDLA